MVRHPHRPGRRRVIRTLIHPCVILYPHLLERLDMTTYQVTFSYTVEVETDGDDRDAEDMAFSEFEKFLRDAPSATYFVVHDVEEAE